ncbi:MAG: hypothetical protein JWN89_640 [Parcubacteria group bacterium]|nr:hypothetical protein [Parcubacteria group bacterium]
MKRFSIVILVLVGLSAGYWYKTGHVALQPALWKSVWIGTTYPPLSNGLSSNGALTVGDARYATYVIDEMKTPDGTELWLASMVKGVNGKPIFTVTDALPFFSGADENGNMSIWGVCGYSPDKVLNIDNSIVAQISARDYVSSGPINAKKAWKANNATGKFESIPPVGISCINEGGQE